MIELLHRHRPQHQQQRPAGPLAVRPAAERDADDIARVWFTAWRVAYRGLVPDEALDALSLRERERRWRTRLAGGDPGAHTCVATIGDEVAGYCRLVLPSRDRDTDSATAELASIYVAPERRRRGVGHALMSAALETVRGGGWQRASLWVFVDNRAARAFYARYGFAPDGTTGHDAGTGLDELRLRATVLANDGSIGM